MITFLRRGERAPSSVTEGRAIDDATASAILIERLIPVEVGDAAESPVGAWVADADTITVLRGRGVDGWRLTLRHDAARAQVLDTLVRSDVAFLRTTPERRDEAIALCALPGSVCVSSLEVGSLADAVDAVEAGIGDLILDGWDEEMVGALRDALAQTRLVERGPFPVGLDIDRARTVLSRPLFKAWLDQVDGQGAIRPRHGWAPGKDMAPPVPARRLSVQWLDTTWRRTDATTELGAIDPQIAMILERSIDGIAPTRAEVATLFRARGGEVEAIAAVADELRRRTVGDEVTYVVNRNINYTNLCYFRCGFCGFSKGPKSLNLRGAPYMLTVDEVADRAVEAAERGATEVCLQGGIHPDYDGDFYVSVLETIKDRLPTMHCHGFTALEVWQGAETLGIPVRELLTRLRDAGLGTLPGTAAEVLDDQVRLHLCPDKIRTAQWAEVHITAHELGLRSNNTLMFGHIDGPENFANHFEIVRAIQRRTGGFTEFVPLPFVHMGAPIYLQGKARPGPTWDEVVLVHAVGRIAFDGLIPNIQASWVKLGLEGGKRLLSAGCNDLGGTLMDENISRAAGASHGQLATPEDFRRVIAEAGRSARERTTLYGTPPHASPVAATV
jgi:FO synthase